MARLRSRYRAAERHGEPRQNKGAEPQESFKRERPLDQGKSGSFGPDSDFADAPMHSQSSVYHDMNCYSVTYPS